MAIKVPKTEEQYINKIYDTQKESTLRTLKSAYNNNVSALDTASTNTNENAYEAKRQSAGDAAITRQRLNETFAANGLNTGAVGQANLALLNQKAANLNDIETARVQAQREFDAQRAALMQTYQAEVKSAIQQNDADKAAALYAAWKEQQAQAQALARSRASGGSGGSKKKLDDDFTDGGSGGGNSYDFTKLNENQGSIGGSYYSTASKEIASMSRTDAEKYLRDLRDNNYLSPTEYQVLVKQARRA